MSNNGLSFTRMGIKEVMLMSLGMTIMILLLPIWCIVLVYFVVAYIVSGIYNVYRIIRRYYSIQKPHDDGKED